MLGVIVVVEVVVAVAVLEAGVNRGGRGSGGCRGRPADRSVKGESALRSRSSRSS